MIFVAKMLLVVAFVEVLVVKVIVLNVDEPVTARLVNRAEVANTLVEVAFVEVAFAIVILPMVDEPMRVKLPNASILKRVVVPTPLLDEAITNSGVSAPSALEVAPNVFMIESFA